MDKDFWKKVKKVRDDFYAKERQEEQRHLERKNFSDNTFFNEVLIPVFDETFGNNYKISSQNQSCIEIRITIIEDDAPLEKEYIFAITEEEYYLEHYDSGKRATCHSPFDFEFYRQDYSPENSKIHFKSELLGLFIELANRGY